MALNPRLEMEFYRLQGKFFHCEKEPLCCENLARKLPVGEYGWFYNPPAEFVGERYAGIVLVMAKPDMPVNSGINPELREKILAFLASPTLQKGRDMNRIVGGFIKNFLVVRSGKADYQSCGIDDYSRIAFMNIYKCRVKEGGMDEIIAPYILEPCVRGYLDRQMEILRPILILYQWPFVYNALLKLKELDENYDPAYGAEVLVGPDENAPESERSATYSKICERIKAILDREDARNPDPVA